MGICSSCESTQVATAKLILQDGRLQEFSYPVKASHVLSGKNYIICSADEMEFDGVVRGVAGDERLQLGQIYFALPVSRLKRPLQAEEMAALAVKASAALMKSATRCGCKKKLVFPVEEKERGRMAAAVSGRRRGGRGFSEMLSAIPE